MLQLLASSQAFTDTLGVGFTFLILLPVLMTALIIVSVISGRGEKRDNDKLAGRWGKAAQRRNREDA